MFSSKNKKPVLRMGLSRNYKKTAPTIDKLLEKASSSPNIPKITEASVCTNSPETSSPAIPEGAPGRSKYLKPLKRGFGLSRKFKSPMLSPHTTTSSDIKVAATKVEESPRLKRNGMKENVAELATNASKPGLKQSNKKTESLCKSPKIKNNSCSYSSVNIDTLLNDPILTTVIKEDNKSKTVKGKKAKKSLRSKEASDDKIEMALINETDINDSIIKEDNKGKPVKRMKSNKSLKNEEVNDDKTEFEVNNESKAIKEDDKSKTPNKSKKSLKNKEASDAKIELEVNNELAPIVDNDGSKTVKKSKKSLKSEGASEDKIEPMANNESEIKADREEIVAVKRKLVVSSDSESDLELLSKVKEKVVTCMKSKGRNMSRKMSSRLSLKSNRSIPISNDSDSDEDFLVRPKKLPRFLSNVSSTSSITSQFEKLPLDSQSQLNSKEIAEDMVVSQGYTDKIVEEDAQVVQRGIILGPGALVDREDCKALKNEDSDDDFLVRPKKLRRILSNASSISSISSQFEKPQEGPINSQDIVEEMVISQEIPGKILEEDSPDVQEEIKSTPSALVERENSETLRKQAISLDLEVQSLEKYLDQLKHAKIFRAKQSIEDIKKDTKMWKDGCEEGLRDLLKMLQETTPITMEVLLQRLKIPPEILSYNELQDCFN